MRHLVLTTLAALTVGACGGGQPAKSPATETKTETEPSGAPIASPAATETDGDTGDENQFVLGDSDTAGRAHGAAPSNIEPTETHAAMKLFVIDKDKGPIEGIVISLTAPDGEKYFTKETDSEGYAEVLVPVGQKYDLVYLSLGRQDVAATVPVGDEPRQNIKLTLRYKYHPDPEKPKPFVLKGVQFDTGKATIRPESYPRLDRVVEYMKHKRSARILISGHTDDVGDAEANKDLSDRRAKACRDYLISKGIEKSRVEAVGYGEERPIAPNSTEEGRQRNRRIEAREL